MPTSSLDAERFRITVAPFRASSTEGGTGAHRSSQISTPITKLGMVSQAKVWFVQRLTCCPHSSIPCSTPLPDANHRCS